jgi:hypothetical protein
MYSMPTRPTFGVDSTNDPNRLASSPSASELERPARAGRWRGYLALLELFGAAAFVIAAPLADREIVPATFVDQVEAAFDADMPDNGGFTLEATAGEPIISMATSN